MLNIKKWLGGFKFVFGRLTSYLGIVNFLMLLYIFILNKPFGGNGVVWVLVIIFVCVGITVFDLLFVVEEDADFGFDRCPKMVKVKKDVERILSILEENNK